MFIFKHFLKSNKRQKEGYGDGNSIPSSSSISLKDVKKQQSKKSQSDIPKKSSYGVSVIPLPKIEDRKMTKALSDRSHLPKETGGKLVDLGEVFFSTPDIWNNAPTSPITIPGNKIKRTLRRSVSIESSSRGDSFEYDKIHQVLSSVKANSQTPSQTGSGVSINIEQILSCSTDLHNDDPLQSLSPFDKMMALAAIGSVTNDFENNSVSDQSIELQFNNVRPLPTKDNKERILIAEMEDPVHLGRSMTVVIKKQLLCFETAMSDYRALHESNIQRFLSDPIFSGDRGYPYIVAFVDHTLSKSANLHYIIMEYCIHGDLLNFITKQTVKASSPITRLLLRDVAMGLKFMHKKNIAHRDLKLENIFLAWNKNAGRVIAKIGDFGHASQIFEKTKDPYTLGSPDYAAPELYRNENHNSLHGDRWSYGVCLFSSFEKRFPFQVNRTREGFVVNPFTVDGEEMKTYSVQINWMKAEPEFEDLISKLFIYEPKKRLGMKEILRHDFFKKMVYPLVL